MLLRSILLSAFFVFPATALAEDALADLDPDFEADLEEIQNAPTATENANADRRQASFDALDEEEEFEIDLSYTTPANPVVDPDAELEPLEVKSEGLQDTNEPIETSNNAFDSIDDEIEEVPMPVAPEAKNIDWNLDLDEDIEIGDKEIKSKQESKSAPVDLDFLDEE